MATIDNLIVTREQMEAAINNFETRKMAMENAYLKISNEVRELDGTWHGDASEKFKGQFEALYKNLQQNETVMSNVISNLKTALNIYQEQEDAATNLYNSMDEGTAYTSHL